MRTKCQQLNVRLCPAAHAIARPTEGCRACTAGARAGVLRGEWGCCFACLVVSSFVLRRLTFGGTRTRYPTSTCSFQPRVCRRSSSLSFARLDRTRVSCHAPITARITAEPSGTRPLSSPPLPSPLSLAAPHPCPSPIPRPLPSRSPKTSPPQLACSAHSPASSFCAFRYVAVA